VRADSGALFENFIINEIIKYSHYSKKDLRINYWRTRHRSEVDLIIEASGLNRAIEIKLTKDKSSGLSAFKNRYQKFQTNVINSLNFY